ncbi:hypothetical protein GP486_006952 [Trichoglossum hirsutum]|uniref:Extracellular membrane protein CFEM domain-containing protein n=1 Tax=Trichoglossum hirsutum TaxID=265104 RepID=A0A9P8IG93_9PEZI|nr:hypothetical protein GP486_006952 [Trichoglossum hirsutum]
MVLVLRVLLPLLAVSLGVDAALTGRKDFNSTTPPERWQTGQNATTNIFHTDEFFKALAGPCKRFSDHLEACPSDALNASKDRFASAQLFAECLARQYGDYFFCSRPFQKLKFLPVESFPAMYNTKNYSDLWKNATLPDFPTKQSCQRPSVVNIMEKACAFDYSVLNGSDCCSSPRGKEPCGRESFNLLACSIQTLHTYVGCTAREQDPDVEKCVVDTAPRINFVPIGFQVNSNGNQCPHPNETIGALIRWSIIEWLAFLFANIPFIIRLFQRHLLGQKGVELRDKNFQVNILGFWGSLGLDIGEIVIVGTLLSRVGYQVDIFKEFVIWSVRPRSAFLNGVLGAIDGGWTHDAITDMVAHILLSIFAIRRAILPGKVVDI